MNRKNFYFDQKVKESELDAAFDDVEEAVKNLVADFSYVGIVLGGQVVENAPQNFTVDVQGPFRAYDQNQERIAFSATQDVNCALDELGAGTAVGSSGNEKWLSIYAEHVRVQSDPRVDGFSSPLFFLNNDSFRLNVVQGAEVAAPAGSGDKPPLRADQILLADIRIAFAQTQIVNADIDTTRAEIAFDLTGTPLAIRQRNLQDVLQDMVDAINGFEGGDIVATPVSDSPFSLAGTTVAAQLAELLVLVNDETAHTNQPTVFTSLPVTFDKDDADDALRTTTKHAGDHPSVPGNIWKLIDVFPTKTNRKIRLYVGTSASYGQIILTVNASWDPDNLLWSADISHAQEPATAFVMRSDATDVSNAGILSKQDTSSSWADGSWDTVSAAGNAGHFRISGDYKYHGVKARTMYIPLISGQTFDAAGTGNGWEFDTGNTLQSRADDGIVRFPIRLPSGCTITGIKAQVFPNNTTGVVTLSAAYVTHSEGSGNGGGGLGSSDVSDGTSSRQTLDLGSISRAVDNDAEEYYIQIQAATDGGTNPDVIEWVLVEFNDPGLQNG